MPSWVEPDPLRSRAIDALGLQTTADRIADDLVPGLSVLTTRARYFTVLSWARRACGPQHDEARIHRLEVALAIREAATSRSTPEHADTCRYVGSRNLARRTEFAGSVPKDPRRVYRVPAWRAYRASMESLGLLDGHYGLTDDGDRAARAFSAACRPDPSGKRMLPAGACLSRCSREEGDILVRLLGVWGRGPPRSAETDVGRRGALFSEIREFFDDGFDVARVLEAYEALRGAGSPTVMALREAAIWERLSLGLNATFLLWLAAFEPDRRRSTVQLLRRTRRTRRGAGPLDAIPVASMAGEEVARRAFASIRRALELRSRLDAEALSRSDGAAFELGEALVGGATPIADVLRAFEERHCAVKGDEAWLRRGPQASQLARDPGEPWELPQTARLHPYRLWAFGQILADLKRARR